MKKTSMISKVHLEFAVAQSSFLRQSSVEKLEAWAQLLIVINSLALMAHVPRLLMEPEMLSL